MSRPIAPDVSCPTGTILPNRCVLQVRLRLRVRRRCHTTGGLRKHHQVSDTGEKGVVAHFALGFAQTRTGSMHTSSRRWRSRIRLSNMRRLTASLHPCTLNVYGSGHDSIKQSDWMRGQLALVTLHGCVDGAFKRRVRSRPVRLHNLLARRGCLTVSTQRCSRMGAPAPERLTR